MKLTEKELNEFPIGTRVISRVNEYVKVGKDVYGANCPSKAYYCSKEISTYGILNVFIPTYTEYIPPKPILDEKEKEYLSNLIRPFRERVHYIYKNYVGEGEEEYIGIAMDKSSDGFSLPNFKAGTMYKDMKLNRNYTLKELRFIVDEKAQI